MSSAHSAIHRKVKYAIGRKKYCTSVLPPHASCCQREAWINSPSNHSPQWVPVKLSITTQFNVFPTNHTHRTMTILLIDAAMNYNRIRPVKLRRKDWQNVGYSAPLHGVTKKRLFNLHGPSINSKSERMTKLAHDDDAHHVLSSNQFQNS